VTTTEHIFSIEEAEAHLRQVDPVLGAIIDRIGPYKMTRRSDPYYTLLRAILYQQLAGSAAAAIERRFFALYGDSRPPTPAEILGSTEAQMRNAGLSRQKVAYIRDLAQHVLDGRLDLNELVQAPDDEVIRRITAVKGLGEWSAQMFLMFHLGRPDVLPLGDLGVRRGMGRAYGLTETPTPAEAKLIGDVWAPYRSVGSWFMWRMIEPVANDL
jgi:3-methyladenine DNA glycosylase/8-oxoguanine DNA glycosylase